MTWTAPMTFVDGAALTASQLNTYLRDNMNETEVAKATSAGGLFISSGPNEIVERVGGSSVVDEQEDTTSTTYTNLATVGPSITCNTGTRAFWFVSCQMASASVAVSLQVGLEITGKTNQAAATVMEVDGLTANHAVTFGNCGFYETLVPGESTFTMKYQVPSGATGTFGNRSLTVIPF